MQRAYFDFKNKLILGKKSQEILNKMKKRDIIFVKLYIILKLSENKKKEAVFAKTKGLPMKYENQNLDFEVYVRLHDLRKILSKYQPDGEFDEEMNRYLELIRTKRYRVAVLGEFSRGKSSLINALLGSSVLPADVLPSTATINRVTFGLDPHVEIIYKDGKREDIAIDAMESYVTKLTEESQEKASTIEEAVVVYPTVICQNHIDIIDTPGLNDSEDMTFLTKSQLNRIDAAIVTISALSPLSETERLLITSLIESEEIGYLIFAVSFIDRIDEEDVDRVLEDIRSRISRIADEIAQRYGADSPVTQKANRILRQPELYGISAKKALKAFETNNNKLLKASCFPDFQKALYRILTTQQNVNAIYKSLHMMLGMQEKLENWYQRKKTAMEENAQRVQEACTAMEAFHGEELLLMQQLLQKNVIERESGNFLADIYEKYRSACIAELAKVTVDSAEAIMQSITVCEQGINEITISYLEEIGQDLREQLLTAMHGFKEQREERFCLVMEEADAGLGQELRTWMEEAVSEAENLQIFKPQPFTFQSNQIADIKHCNVIALLEKQASWYSNLTYSSMKQTYEMVRSIGMKVANMDVKGKQDTLNRYREFIHNVMTDNMLYERQYVKHQEELEELFTFCKELEEEILK